MPQACRPYTDPMQDGRRKIHPDDHEQVKLDYRELKSMRKVAAKWNISKRLVQYILDPDKLIETRQRAQERNQYQATRDRVKGQPWRDTIRKYRAKKRALGLMYNPNKE